MNTTFNFWVNNRSNSRGKFDIFIRITQLRKHKLIKTGVAIPNREAFNQKAKQENWIRGRDISSKKLNIALADKLESLKDEMQVLDKKAKNPSKESIASSYKGESSKDFIGFLKLVISRQKKAGSYRTASRYNQLLNKLIAFESETIPFDLINVTFLKNFESYLSSIPLHQNSRHAHFKCFKATINQAIQEEIISSDQNPFLRFKFFTVETRKEKLTFPEVNRLNALKLKKGSLLKLTRDAFMFAFYCGGIRVGDLISLRWNNIQDNKVRYVMAKTKNKKLTERVIPLIPEALAILKQYHTGNSLPEHFIFGMIDNKESKYIANDKSIKPGHEVRILNRIASRNTVLNRNLKTLATDAKITKTLTFHISRHSFAQYAIDSGTPIKTLQSILGHSKMEHTEIYVKALDDKQTEEAMKKIFR